MSLYQDVLKKGERMKKVLFILAATLAFSSTQAIPSNLGESSSLSLLLSTVEFGE